MAATRRKEAKGSSEIEGLAMNMGSTIFEALCQGLRPKLESMKCSLDNSEFSMEKGILVPTGKKVVTELNTSSVKKMSRAMFMLDIILNNVRSGAGNTKRELYYIAKGWVKSDPSLKPLDFADQKESDEIIDFLCTLLEVYREDINCFANDRGGQTFSKQLIVIESLPNGKIAEIDLGNMGTSPFQPKNKPQSFTLKKRGKIDFCLIVESEGTTNTLVNNGFTERHNCILMGSQGVPSNGVRGWAKTIETQLNVPMYFFGDLDAYTVQNIFRTLKAGSAQSLIRNENFSAPNVKFLGVLPHDIQKYGLHDYHVKKNDEKEGRSLKKAADALKNDPFFKAKSNAKLAEVLRWLIRNERRCEQQAYFSVDYKDPTMPEKIIVEKIKKGDFV